MIRFRRPSVRRSQQCVSTSEADCKIRESDQSVACSLVQTSVQYVTKLIRETTPRSLSCQRTTSYFLG